MLLLSITGFLCPHSVHSESYDFLDSPNRILPLVDNGVISRGVSFSNCVCGRDADAFEKAIESVTAKLLKFDSSSSTMSEVRMIQQILSGVLPEKSEQRSSSGNWQSKKYATGKEQAKSLSRRHRNATQVSQKKPTRAWQSYRFREELLVAVAMGSREPGIDRMLTVQDSWGLDVSQTVFYLSASLAREYGEDLKSIASVVQMDDDSLLMSPLAVLHHLYSNFLDRYNWFLLAVNGSVYVRGWQLEEMLSYMDPEQEVYLGHPAMGTDSNGSPVHYCSSGPGIILSRAALNSLFSSSEGACSKLVQLHGKSPTFTWNDYDRGLGGCVEKAMGVICASGEEQVCWLSSALTYQHGCTQGYI